MARLVSADLLDLLGLFAQSGRTPGRHVSSAIYRVMKNLHPERFGDGPLDQARMILGNALEHTIIEAMAAQYPDRYVRPGELIYRGVKGTPDLWDLQEWATVEVKLTWATAGRASDIDDVWFWRYWQQLKAYSKMAGMTKGILVIFFINGTWMHGDPGAPQGMMFEENFTDEDLDETWQLIDAYAEEETEQEIESRQSSPRGAGRPDGKNKQKSARGARDITGRRLPRK